MSRPVVAAVVGLTVLGATVAPAAAATPTAAPASVAARATVALQVQNPNGTVRTWCVPYRAGMTGADVVARANPTYGTGPYAGFVLQVNGKGKVPPTASRYWAYWRSTTGTADGYSYSSAGVTATRPSAGSVETWVWNAGSTTTFPHRSYAELCPTA